MQLAAEQQLDRYTVVDCLGQGGMAIVYRLRHNQLETEHALKVLTLTKKSVRKRLVLEGKVQANLRHNNIVAVTDVLNLAGAPGLLMEYIAGPSLEELLERYRPTLAESEALFRGIVDGVAHAHSQGLVHRDLKPANVMLQVHNQTLIPKVADFGLAKAFADDEDDDERGKTRTGIAMGTPSFMPPEQIRSAKEVDARADIFALGCILYEMCTGQRCFDGEDLPTIFNQIFAGTYDDPKDLNPDLPERFLTAIRGCLLSDRDRRIPNCETLLAVLSGTPWDMAKPIESTWSGSAENLPGVVDPQAPQPADTAGASNESQHSMVWPPPNFSFSDEALQASYAPTPSQLPSIEELALENMGASLIANMDASGASIVGAPQQTIVVQQGGGRFSQVMSVLTVVMLAGIMLMVGRLNPTIQDAVLAPIAAVTPEVVDRLLLPESARERLGLIATDEEPVAVVEDEAEFDPTVPVAEGVATVTRVGANGEEVETTARIDLGSDYYQGTKEEAEAMEAEGSGEEEIKAEVIVDKEEAAEEEVDITIAMTDEEIADLPEDKLESGKGAVIVKGDAVSVWLNSDLGRVRPGMIEAGDYEILADFGEGERGAGTLHVPAGKKIEIRCDAVFRKCVHNLLTGS